MANGYFVTAIGTDSGKTLVSSILVEALKADYWKPIQAGKPTDSETVALLVSKSIQIWPERYVLNTPASPHAAADLEKIHIAISDFKIPISNNAIIVEGAGGLMVPVNHQQTMTDLIRHLGLPVVLVSNLYLGNINHTLLSAYYLNKERIPVKGIVFNGQSNPASEQVIKKMTGLPVLFKIPHLNQIDHTTIKSIASKLKTI